MSFIISLYLLAFLGVCICIVKKEYHRFYLIAKMSCSTLFTTLVFYYAFNQSLVFPWWIVLSFVGFFLGDLFLGLQEKNQKSFFILGLLSFLIAHFIFIGALLTKFDSIPWLALIGSTLSFLITYFLIRFCNLTVKKNFIPFIYLYSYTLTLLVILSGFIYFTSPSLHSFILVTGSVLFLFSDFILIFIYFKKYSILLHVLNLLFYFTAVILLAFSLVI